MFKVNHIFSIFYLMLCFVPTLVWSYATCPNVSQYSDADCYNMIADPAYWPTKCFEYENGAAGDSNPNLPSPNYLSWPQTDGYSVLKINYAHVFNAQAGGMDGAYGNVHMDVYPVKYNCDLSDINLVEPGPIYGWPVTDVDEACVSFFSWSDYSEVEYYEHDKRGDVYDVFQYSFLPGPFQSTQCEWVDTEFLGGANSRVNYSDFLVWDWDDWCFGEDGCADGVYIQVYEGDEVPWGSDDEMIDFYVFKDQPAYNIEAVFPWLLFRPLSANSTGYIENTGTINIELYNQLDFDDDGLHDDVEISLGTDPENSDSDGDSLSDYREVEIHGTNPLLVDTDGDQVSDDREIELGLDPNRRDSPAVFLILSRLSDG